MKLVALKPAEAGFVCVDAVLTASFPEILK